MTQSHATFPPLQRSLSDAERRAAEWYALAQVNAALRAGVIDDSKAQMEAHWQLAYDDVVADPALLAKMVTAHRRGGKGPSGVMLSHEMQRPDFAAGLREPEGLATEPEAFGAGRRKLAAVGVAALSMAAPLAPALANAQPFSQLVGIAALSGGHGNDLPPELPSPQTRRRTTATIRRGGQDGDKAGGRER